jgi:hypothetical protein
MFINVLEILWLEAEVIEGLPTGGVIEDGYQPVQIGSKSGELMIAPGFAK